MNGNVIDLGAAEITDTVFVNKGTGEVLVMDVKLAEVETSGLWTVIEATQPEQLEKLAAYLALAAQRLRAMRAAARRVPA